MLFVLNVGEEDAGRLHEVEGDQAPERVTAEAFRAIEHGNSL